MRRIVLIMGASLAAMAGCGRDAPTPSGDAGTTDASGSEALEIDANATLLDLAGRHAEALLSVTPELATDLGVGPAIAGDSYLSTLGGYGFTAREGAAQMNEQFLTDLQAIDRSALTGLAEVTYRILDGAYRAAARRNQFEFGGATPLGYSLPNSGDAWAVTPYFVTQLTGPHIALPRMMESQHPFTSAQDADAYLIRLGDFGRALDEVIETLGADAAAGVVPPVFVIDGALNVIAGLTAPAPADHPLVQTLRTKSPAIGALPADEVALKVARAGELVETTVYPAYAALADELRRLREQSTPDAGVWRLGEAGAQWYQMALQAYGARDRDADAVHDLGLAEVARINAELDVLLRGIGRTNGTVGERLIALGDDPDNLFPNTDDGRDALLAYLREAVSEMEAELPKWFARVPGQSIEVKRIPPHEQDTSPGAYYSAPSLDGSRAGSYWINLKDTGDNPKSGLKTLTYHEGVPGHHLSISFSRAIADMPLLRNVLSYSEMEEGWALYGEHLAKEMGMYTDDPLGDIGRLQAELFRAARLVVDTGLHHKRWTREEAIDWMVATTGSSRASVTREVERYAAIPGQACAYKLGMIAMQELRKRAETELGDKFDIRAFHNVVLSVGSAPIDIIARQVELWILAQMAAAPE